MQFDRLRRREFITLLGAAAGWPLTARAQRPGRLPTIGFMGTSTRAVEEDRVAAFEQRLGQLGWSDGRNIRIEYRWAEARWSALPRLRRSWPASRST